MTPTHTDTCLHTLDTHTHLHTHTPTHSHRHTYTCTHTHQHTHTGTCTHTPTHTGTHTPAHTHTCTHTRCRNSHTQTPSHTYTRLDTHTDTHISVPPPLNRCRFQACKSLTNQQNLCFHCSGSTFCLSNHSIRTKHGEDNPCAQVFRSLFPLTSTCFQTRRF